MIVLNSPKGWTGPKVVDGLQVEGTFRAHQVPLSDPATHPEHLKLLEDWLRSYRPEELFDERGRLKPELAELRPARALWAAVLGTQMVATLIAVYGLFMTPLSWGWAAFVWGYALAWFLVNDRVKLLAYRILDPSAVPLLSKKPLDLTPEIAGRG
jgi:hypothetical protein